MRINTFCRSVNWIDTLNNLIYLFHHKGKGTLQKDWSNFPSFLLYHVRYFIHLIVKFRINASNVVMQSCTIFNLEFWSPAFEELWNQMNNTLEILWIFTFCSFNQSLYENNGDPSLIFFFHLQIHPWRRPASLRVRPTFNSENASGSNSGKLSNLFFTLPRN